MKRKLLISGAVVVTLTLLVSFNFNRGDRYFEIVKNLDIFAELFQEVNAYYVDEVNPNTLIKDGIDAMLSNLDPYTNFIPEDQIEDYRTMTTGQYGGIGAIIGRSNGKNLIIMPYEGFPAAENGLNIGDELIEIDGIDITDKNTTDISKLLKGQAGTKVKLKVRRPFVDEPLSLELLREKITINNVPFYGMVDANTGYVKLTDFTTGAGKEVHDAVEELKGQGATRMILDLRGNPGGLLNEAINVSNVFVPKGSEIVSTRGKVTEWNQTYTARSNPVDTEIPLVVLTDNMSASASEIVAGTMQDYDRGVLVGNKTFGKGLVQATRSLTYNSQLKITTAKYYTPSGRCIQAIDYSHRNPDGSVGKIPDSLKTAFRTINGREVFDGGGIDPDVEVEDLQYAPITLSLLSKGLVFDYATRYYYAHEAPESPESIQLTDQDYADFKSWLKGKDYDYTTSIERTIDELIASAKKEKYYDRVKEEIYSLREEVMHNKEEDLEIFKEEIMEVLEEEIAGRYFLQEGVIQASFDNDVDVTAALDILNDTDRYNKILGRY